MKRCIYNRLWAAFLVLCAASVLLVLCMAHGQEIQLAPGTLPLAQPGRQRIALESTNYTVVAGQPDWIELRFQIAPGLHINSHTPHDETLIPTALQFAPSPEVRVLKDEYPAGTPMHLSIGTGTTLSTYTGDLRIRVQVQQPKGEAELSGKLHYQACDAASCYPPRDLPLALTLNAR